MRNGESRLPDMRKLAHPEAVRQYGVEERRDKAERKQLAAAHENNSPPNAAWPPVANASVSAGHPGTGHYDMVLVGAYTEPARRDCLPNGPRLRDSRP